MQRDEVVLQDIIKAARLVKDFIQGLEIELFMQVCPHPECDSFSSGPFAPLPMGAPYGDDKGRVRVLNSEE